MIVEQATVVAVDEKHLLVETIQQSTCGSCAAQKGCGQGVLAKYLSSSSFFRLSLKGFSGESFQPGDTVEIGIDEFALVRASVWLYLVPLAGLLVGAFLGNTHSQWASILFAMLGMAAGCYLSWRHSKNTEDHSDYVPTLVMDAQAIRIVDSSPAI